MWLVATLVFVMFFVLLPKPTRNLAGGQQATPATMQRVSRELHLSAPLHEQYLSYMWRLLEHQSPGTSPNQYAVGLRRGVPDTGTIARRAIPPTLSVVILTLLVSLGVGGLAGFALARTRWRRAYGLPIYVAVGLLPVCDPVDGPATAIATRGASHRTPK
jgi:ABC-type dipeptide/oligopeptide/nickel transport system permease component